MKRLNAFNNEKLNKTLKTRWNQQPQGSVYTNHYGTRPEPIRKEVARCGADLIDAVEMIVEGEITNSVFNEPFSPPPEATRANEVGSGSGETLTQQRHRLQQHCEKESDTLAQQFRKCEEERQRSWRRMLKVKAELNISQQCFANQRPVYIPVTDHNYHMIAMPNIAVAGAETIPRELDMPRSILPSYVPARHSKTVEPTTHDKGSKYTIARVRARISADGSVAPVTLPRRGPDGLYARPSGRTRKGMDWDAINGKWIPA
jgi:hypothetical protein